jgi:CO/xanthine dehydrogenase FAD-binding subunit
VEFERPSDLAGALGLLAERPNATILAGGTDLMVEINAGMTRPAEMVGIRRVAELEEWSATRIGAGVTYQRLEHGGIRGLAQASRTVGSPQIRNAGTIGGNVGTASPAGDTLPFLAAVGASVELRSMSASRIVPITEFITGVKRTDQRPGELITAVVLPDDMPERQEFAKVGVRNAMVISMVSACVVRWADGRVRSAFGAAGPVPILADDADEVVTGVAAPSEATMTEYRRLVEAAVRPITDHRGTERYRRHAAGVLAQRLLERCLS